MEITEVRVRLTHESSVGPKSEKLLAYCSITIGQEFVVRDIKVIESGHGVFVAMPSRKLSDRCPRCGGKNHLRARFCNDCGGKLDPDRAGRDGRGRARLHADVAHPINATCRERVQDLIIATYRDEHRKSQLPGYVPQELHEFQDGPASEARKAERGAERRDSGGGAASDAERSGGGALGFRR